MVVVQLRAPAEVSRRFAEAINAGDLEGALACWSPVGVLVSSDGAEIRGHVALTERFSALIEAGAQMQISVSNEICTELGATASTRMRLSTVGHGDFAVEAAAVVMYVPGPDGLQILIDRLDEHSQRAG